MKSFRKQFYVALPLSLLCMALVPPSAKASLIGAGVTAYAQYQSTATTAPRLISFTATATVSDASVEFPMLGDLTRAGTGFFIVNSEADFSANNLTLDFRNAGTGVFASGFETDYVFSFGQNTGYTLTDATINRSATNLGVTDSDIRIADNQLFINVESVRYSPSSFLALTITSTNSTGGGTVPTGPTLPEEPGSGTGASEPTSVPEPGSLTLLAVGLAGLSIRARQSSHGKL